MKAGDYIHKTVASKLPLEIYTVEIEPFSKFINQLAIGFECDLLTYIKILKWNNYLKVEFDGGIISQI